MVSFIAPQVSHPEEVVICLEVSDGVNSVSSQATVTIFPVVGNFASQLIWEKLGFSVPLNYANGFYYQAWSNAAAPAEMGWQGNHLILEFHFPVDSTILPPVYFKMDITLVANPVSITFSAGSDPDQLTELGMIEVNEVGPVAIEIPVGLIDTSEDGKLILEMLGDNQDGVGQPSGIKWGRWSLCLCG